jgi:hypothetical protein
MVGFISRFDQWLLVLPLAAVTLALSLRRLVAPTLAIIAWSLMSFLGFAAIYWIGWLGIDYYISSSANRVSSTLPIVVGTTAPLLLGLAFDGTRSEARGFAARSWPRRSTRKRVTADALTDAPLGRSG